MWKNSQESGNLNKFETPSKLSLESSTADTTPIKESKPMTKNNIAETNNELE